jgi:hypothetical protein
LGRFQPVNAIGRRRNIHVLRLLASFGISTQCAIQSYGANCATSGSSAGWRRSAVARRSCAPPTILRRDA